MLLFKHRRFCSSIGVFIQGQEVTMSKSVAELTDAELQAAWEDGNWLASQGGITPEHEQLLEEIERELARRSGRD
jgi:hypothetical protein